MLLCARARLLPLACLLAACGSTLPELAPVTDTVQDGGIRVATDAGTAAPDAAAMPTRDASSPVPTDGSVVGRDGGVADAGDAGGACTTDFSECAAFPSTVLSVEGSTPYGVPTVERVSVSYVNGFANYTAITLHGTLRGTPFELTAEAWPDLRNAVATSVAPPGNYSGLETELIWRRGDGSCPGEFPTGNLRITVHTAPKDPQPGNAIGLRGVATVDGAGWSLRVGFAVSAACSSWHGD